MLDKRSPDEVRGSGKTEAGHGRTGVSLRKGKTACDESRRKEMKVN